MQGKFEEAAILNERVLELSTRYPEVKIPLEALSNMAATLAGQVIVFVEATNPALAPYKLLGMTSSCSEPHQLQRCFPVLQGKFDAADEVFAEIVSAMRKNLSSDDPRLVRTLDNMADSLMHQVRY